MGEACGRQAQTGKQGKPMTLNEMMNDSKVTRNMVRYQAPFQRQHYWEIIPVSMKFKGILPDNG
jgi:hypothetical protein